MTSAPSARLATSARRLARAVAPGMLRVSARRAGVALVYHRVGTGPPPHAGNVVPTHPAGLFESQLRMLSAHYRLVPASGLAEAAAGRRRGQRFPVSITFDDDLASHATLAAPALSRRAVPATFFLCGASLAGPRCFWWERLERALLREPDARRLWAAISPGRPLEGRGDARAIASVVESATPVERREIDRRLLSQAGPDPADAGLRAAQVRDMVARGFEIGFHTLRHDVLPPLDDPDLSAALRDGRADLEAAAGPVKLLSYPHGRADRRVAVAAREAGYAAAFTGAGEAWGPSTDTLLIPRVEPSFRSARELRDQITRALWRAGGA